MRPNYKTTAKTSLNFLRINSLTLRGLLVIIILLSLLQLYVSNRFVTDGESIKEADAKTDALRAENMRIENQIEQLGSLSYIKTKATELGFIKIDKVQYLNEPVTVASR